jgi:hypothetical protein
MRRPVLALLLLTLAAPAWADYQVISTSEVSPAGGLVRTDTTVEVDGAFVDRFQVHRLRKAHQAPRGAILLLPPLGNPFSFFEVDEEGVYERSFAAFFAHQGWEVWGYTPRGYHLAAGACADPALDCSPLADWGVATAVEDVAFIRDRIAEALPGVEPIVGGYSLGAIHTIAVLDAQPEAWRAGFVLEGALYSEDPAVRARTGFWCAVYEGLLAAGSFFDDQLGPTVRLVAQLAAAAPDAPTPLPGFPPGTTNHQVLVFLLAVPMDDPASPVPGMVRCIGSVADDELFVCDDDRVVAHSLVFLDVFGNRTLRDLNCALAGERTFTDGLDAFAGDLLVLGAELGFGPTDADQLSLFTAADTEHLFHAGLGHADFWFAPYHRSLLETELLRWLNGL